MYWATESDSVQILDHLKASCQATQWPQLEHRERPPQEAGKLSIIVSTAIMEEATASFRNIIPHLYLF